MIGVTIFKFADMKQSKNEVIKRLVSDIPEDISIKSDLYYK